VTSEMMIVLIYSFPVSILSRGYLRTASSDRGRQMAIRVHVIGIIEVLRRLRAQCSNFFRMYQ